MIDNETKAVMSVINRFPKNNERVFVIDGMNILEGIICAYTIELKYLPVIDGRASPIPICEKKDIIIHLETEPYEVAGHGKVFNKLDVFNEKYLAIKHLEEKKKRHNELINKQINILKNKIVGDARP